MWDTIEKLEYRARAGIAGVQAVLENRLAHRLELPLRGIHGEKLYLTGINKLQVDGQELKKLYDTMPECRGVQDTILLDACSSATIEGARTTVAQVKACFDHPRTRDDRMVINTVKASRYAYEKPITQRNLRRLWEIIVEGVCENEGCRGTQYRDGMVFVGSQSRTVHTPAPPEQLPGRMEEWFAFLNWEELDPLLRFFAAHFYFVYLHPFCDGNGRTARVLNASQLYHSGFRKMKHLPLSGAINQQLSGYYGSLADSETVLHQSGETWLDLSPFVSYMLEVFERCIIDAALAANTLTEQESRLLERMNQAGAFAEITSKKAAVILDCSQACARGILNALVEKGYLTACRTQVPHVFRLNQHLPFKD